MVQEGEIWGEPAQVRVLPGRWDAQKRLLFFPEHHRSLGPGPSLPLALWGHLRAAVISSLCSPGLSLLGRPDADPACRASINYSTAKHGQQWGRHQLLHQSMGAPWPNPTWTKNSPVSVPMGMFSSWVRNSPASEGCRHWLLPGGASQNSSSA